MTSEFHRIQRELDVVAGDSRDGTPSARARADRQRLERQLDSLGGRQAYQEASVLTTARHRTCKWVFAVLTKLGMRPRKNQSPLRVLEIGAVNTQLLSVPWLDVRAIDIKSQHPRIEQVDFFDVPPNADKDVVVCAMVLELRGEARRARAHARRRRATPSPAGTFSSCSRGGASPSAVLHGARFGAHHGAPRHARGGEEDLAEGVLRARAAPRTRTELRGGRRRFPDPPREIRRRKERGGATDAPTDRFAVAVAAAVRGAVRERRVRRSRSC